MGRTLRLAIGACLVAFALALALTPPSGPRSMREFNPTRLADLELRMWKAYYAKDRARLFGLLVTMLREQYRYSWATATREAFHLARAASTFGDLKGDYEQVLPDLESGYATAKSWLDAGFDPRAVARAELAWWVARRIPGQNSADQVGHLIAQEYALCRTKTPSAWRRPRCCAPRRRRSATSRQRSPTGIASADCSSSRTANCTPRWPSKTYRTVQRSLVVSLSNHERRARPSTGSGRAGP
jgi:hypothetical protein